MYVNIKAKGSKSPAKDLTRNKTVLCAYDLAIIGEVEAVRNRVALGRTQHPHLPIPQEDADQGRGPGHWLALAPEHRTLLYYESHSVGFCFVLFLLIFFIELYSVVLEETNGNPGFWIPCLFSEFFLSKVFPFHWWRKMVFKSFVCLFFVFSFVSFCLSFQ